MPLSSSAAFSQGRDDSACILASLACRYQYRRGQLSEGKTSLEEVIPYDLLNVTPPMGPPEVVANLLPYIDGLPLAAAYSS